MQDAGFRIQGSRFRIKMKKAQSYKNLVIYSLAKELAILIHKLTIEELPKFEIFEQGSQIRRSSKSIVSNIVEGFGRRRYQKDFIQFLTYSVASCDETKAHIEMLLGTGSLNKQRYEYILSKYEELGAKLYKFREAVINNHRSS